ncbi:MAG: VWA domain-containing protein [Chloroflexota bacterium]|nr:MAG: VWA domain-containing protein [Chloroflexota bacterium]
MISAPQLRRQSHVIRNVLAFCRLLKAAKVDISMNKVIDACRCLEFIDLGSREDLYWALRANLASRQEDLKIFDAAFHYFWVRYETPEEQDTCGNEEGAGEGLERHEQVGDEKDMSLEDFAKDDSEDQEPRSMDILAYTPNEVLARKDFGELTDDEARAMRQLIAQLAVKLSTVISHRRRLDPRGDVIDPARMWRRNMRYGGDMVELPRKKRRIRKTKVVLLCDVSGSMDSYSRFLIQFLFAMQNELRNMETFVFSTRLTRITHLLHRRGVQDALDHVAKTVQDWSGGTTIGACLQSFNEKWGRFSLQSKTVVVVISDGWDRGDSGLLAQQMWQIHRRAASIIWLNPLLGSPNYRPLCKGMQAALPSIDYFMPGHNLASLINLVRVLRDRRRSAAYVPQ